LTRGYRTGSPAKEAGVKMGDILTEINGERFASFHDAITKLKAIKKGKITLALQRNQV